MTYEIDALPKESEETIDILSPTSDLTSIDEEPLTFELGASTYHFRNTAKHIHEEWPQLQRRFEQKSSSQENINPSIYEQLYEGWTYRARRDMEHLNSFTLDGFRTRLRRGLRNALFVYIAENPNQIKAFGIKIQKTSSPSLSDTSNIDLHDIVKQEVSSLFRGVEEMFADEAEEALTQRLSDCIRKYQGLVITQIHQLLLNDQLKQESAEITLRVLGDIYHPSTYIYRREFLEKTLIESSSPIVRDGANVGLSYMDDPHSIPFLKMAIEKEDNPLARKLMKKTLIQLEDVEKCLTSCA